MLLSLYPTTVSAIKVKLRLNLIKLGGSDSVAGLDNPARCINIFGLVLFKYLEIDFKFKIFNCFLLTFL